MHTHLEETNRDADSNTSAAQRTLVVRDGPRVTSQGLEDAGQLELALLGGHEKASGTKSLRREGLARAGRSTILRAQAEHVLDLLGRVLLPTTEDV